MKSIRWNLLDNVAVIEIKTHEKINILSLEVIMELNLALDQILNTRTPRGLIITGTTDSFIHHADVGELISVSSFIQAREHSEKIQKTFNRIANSGLITVAAISGACFSCGLDLALVCDWRVAASNEKTMFSYPEINLGIMPFGGGTQRLPRLIGIQSALDMILSGKTLSVEKALEKNLIDFAVVENKLMDKAFLLAKTIKGFKKQFISQKLPLWAVEKNPIGKKILYKNTLEDIEKKTKGFYPAPYKIVNAISQGLQIKLDQALYIEAENFGQLCVSHQSQSLSHLYFAEEKSKEKFLQKKTKPITSVAIIGAGHIGSQIAYRAIKSDIRVLLSDKNQASLSKTLETFYTSLKKNLDRQTFLFDEIKHKMSLLHCGLKQKKFYNTDLFIETIIEDIGQKTKIFQDCEGLKESAIITTNTISMEIKTLSKLLNRKLIGLRYFETEVNEGIFEIISDEMDEQVYRLANFFIYLDCKVIVSKDTFCNLIARVFVSYVCKGLQLVLEGSTIDYIDESMVEFGFSKPPFLLMDEMGVEWFFQSTLAHPSAKKRYPDVLILLEKMVIAQRLGKKMQRGFYTYNSDGTFYLDDTLNQLLQLKPSSKIIPKDEIIDRLLMPIILESIECLEENISQDAYDIDLGVVYGLGFPKFWGGPLKYVDFIGAVTTIEILSQLEKNYQDSFKAPKLLLEMKKSGRKFFPKEPS